LIEIKIFQPFVEQGQRIILEVLMTGM